MAMIDYEIQVIGKSLAKQFVRENHYAITTPPTAKLSIGLFDNEVLKGIAIFGYGVRPKHTIKFLFPSLDVEDYLELNRLCLLDSLPRNSETQFIKQCVKIVRRYYPDVKVLFSWADGLRGKPGYVYQAASWLYGGSIWSQFYRTRDGEVVHPRLLITRYGTRSREFAIGELGLEKIHGFQMRYCKFLCNHKEIKRLLNESPIVWSYNYPKDRDLKWIIEAGEGSRESRELPMLKGSGQFRHPAPENQFTLQI